MTQVIAWFVQISGSFLRHKVLLVESTLARKLRHICVFRFFYVTLQAHFIE